ncbi:MAG: glycosyltransferase family 2 protein [Candidatus Omnitrophica bacterium]|nr:glycosyltransferase family 2 protein [Candidatus Omnitrophota bacterium]MDD5672211.1 glycosyltransferase family 2 protein [Candidatus Omnitrophota bacterium]
MLSIVCPFYNEKENLPILVERIGKVVAGLQESWEVVFVDDGSTDGGPETMATLIAHQPGFRLLRLDRNYGLTTALYAGLRAAQGDVLATLDADLQNPPEEITKLLAFLKEADIVTGVRAKRQDTWLKKISSKIANTVRRAVTKDHIQDIACTLRVFKRETLEAFYPYNGMHRFFLAIAERQGFKIKQVPVTHAPRLYGKAKYGVLNRIVGPLSDLCVVRWMFAKQIRYRFKEGTV